VYLHVWYERCTAVMEEDNGNYTCELRGPQSRVLRQVTHYLFVRGNMSHLLLRMIMTCMLHGIVYCLPQCSELVAMAREVHRATFSCVSCVGLYH